MAYVMLKLPKYPYSINFLDISNLTYFVKHPNHPFFLHYFFSFKVILLLNMGHFNDNSGNDKQCNGSGNDGGDLSGNIIIMVMVTDKKNSEFEVVIVRTGYWQQ